MSGIIGKSKARGSGIISTDSAVESVSGSTGVVADSDIDHDSLANFAANEHYTQANITATGTVASGTWEGTDVAVAHGGTGASTHTANNVLIGAGTSAITSIAPGADGQVLTSTGTVWQSEAAGGGGGGGVTHASQWKLSSGFTGSATPITTWTAANHTDLGAMGYLGDAMTISSGIFTFPATGFWLISAQMYQYHGSPSFSQFYTQVTLDNSNYYLANIIICSPGAGIRQTGYGQTVFDVTSTTNCKVRFSMGQNTSSNTTTGVAAGTETGVTFIKLADT